LIPNTTLAFRAASRGALPGQPGQHGRPEFHDRGHERHPEFQVAPGSHQILGSPVWWDGPDGSYGYIWVSASDFFAPIQIRPGLRKFLLPNYAQSTTAAPGGTPGGILSISANGTNAGSGIVWASHQLGGSANHAVRPGILRAFNAQTSPTNCGTRSSSARAIPSATSRNSVLPRLRTAKCTSPRFPAGWMFTACCRFLRLSSDSRIRALLCPGKPTAFQATRCKPPQTCHRPSGRILRTA